MILSCDKENPMIPIDECGVPNGDNTNECGSCSEYVLLWGECYNIEETIEIELMWDEDLTGSIPSSIGRLINLTSLEINNRYLSGSIPSEIGDLISLTKLNICSLYFL